jgi:hypothetical protein
MKTLSCLTHPRIVEREWLKVNAGKIEKTSFDQHREGGGSDQDCLLLALCIKGLAQHPLTFEP